MLNFLETPMEVLREEVLLNLTLIKLFKRLFKWTIMSLWEDRLKSRYPEISKNSNLSQEITS